MAKRDPSRTEAPTPKRKKEARREGRVARSPDLVTWLSVLVATMVVPGLAARTTDATKELLAVALSAAQQPDASAAPAAFSRALTATLAALLPFLLVMALVALAGGLAQVGFLWSPKALRPQAKRMNPAQGLKRMLGTTGLWATVAAAIRLGVIVSIVWFLLDDLVGRLARGGLRTAPDAVTDVAAASVSIVRAVAVVAVVVAAADYVIKRRDLLSQNRMTKDEVKRELRDAEGDPHLKARVRSMRMAMTRNRMLSEIATADVVLTNPTHFAVAIAYRRTTGAPRVVARGADALAARIRELAAGAGVPCVESRPLARTLWRVCRVGEEIPPELYQGVAVVLAFLHRLGATQRAYGRPLHVDVPDTWNPSDGELARVPPRRRRAEEARARRAAQRGAGSADRNGAASGATATGA